MPGSGGACDICFNVSQCRLCRGQCRMSCRRFNGGRRRAGDRMWARTGSVREKQENRRTRAVSNMRATRRPESTQHSTRIGMGWLLTETGGATLRWNEVPPSCVGTAHGPQHRDKTDHRPSDTLQHGSRVTRLIVSNTVRVRAWLCAARTNVRLRMPMLLDPRLCLCDLDADLAGLLQIAVRLELVARNQRSGSPTAAEAHAQQRERESG